MCVSTINGETHNHTIQKKEPTKQQDIFAMDDSAVILDSFRARSDMRGKKATVLLSISEYGIT